MKPAPKQYGLNPIHQADYENGRLPPASPEHPYIGLYILFLDYSVKVIASPEFDIEQ